MSKISSQQKKGIRTWIEVDTKALKNNYNLFKGLTSGKKLMAVSKSNAYGHGLVPFSKTMEKFGVDWIGVDSVKEGLRLRKEGIKKPILVLGYTMPENITIAISKKISLTLSSMDGLKIFSALSSSLKQKLKFHIKIDTGMSRQGFLPDEAVEIICVLKKKSLLGSVEGIYTHFAQAKNPSFPKKTLDQIAEFKEVVFLFKKEKIKPIVHACATSGTMLFPEAHFDMVRIGIGMYGLWPSLEVRAVYEDEIRLKTAILWKTIVGEVKKIPKGSGIGYDFSEILEKDSLLAVCPIGYWHGYPRALSSVGKVLIKGKKAKILGRVSMDIIVVDVSSIKGVRQGDEVILIGKSGNNEIFVDNLASLSDTINYEIVTRINPLIKRFYI